MDDDFETHAGTILDDEPRRVAHERVDAAAACDGRNPVGTILLNLGPRRNEDTYGSICKGQSVTVHIKQWYAYRIAHDQHWVFEARVPRARKPLRRARRPVLAPAVRLTDAQARAKVRTHLAQDVHELVREVLRRRDVLQSTNE